MRLIRTALARPPSNAGARPICTSTSLILFPFWRRRCVNAPPNVIRLGEAVERLRTGPKQRDATLESGDRVQADLLVAPRYSTPPCARQMLVPDRPTFTGNVAWRAVVPVEKLGGEPQISGCAWRWDAASMR
jgi:hypothetical protein